MCDISFFIHHPFKRSVRSRSIPPFTIYHVSRDSSYANQAIKYLTAAYEEITFDFRLQRDHKFDVYIMPTRHAFREALGGQLPEWTGAYADPTHNRMVVKSPRWSHEKSFQTSLVHELFHLIIHSHLGIRELPRWLDEGLAIFYAGEKRWKTATALSKAISTNSLIPLYEIDYVLQYHQAKADLAYQQSYSAVHYLLTTYDIEAVRKIIDGINLGKSLDKCFLEATGSTMYAFELEWKKYAKKTHKWMWIYEIDQYVWIFIFVLVVLVFVVKKIRSKRIEKEWEEEQSRFENPDAES
jgi:hypothetical protein